MHRPRILGLGVERAQGFVHQQHLGVVGERPRDADALFHPARELRWVVIRKLAQAHPPEPLVGNSVALAR
jgi:hypothetical protein